MRVGIGYDIHTTKKGRRLMIGGVEIPCEFGLNGHSDADVLIHAIIDSILGAAALGDIGRLFPDNDEKYKDADSKVLLKKVCGLLQKNGYKIVNIDSNVIAESPRLCGYIEKIETSLAEIMGLEGTAVSVKAKTNEKQDSIGGLRSIAAQAVCLIDKQRFD